MSIKSVFKKNKNKSPYSNPKKLFEDLKICVLDNKVDRLQEILNSITEKQLIKANNCRKYTPLHVACRKGRKRCIDLLINAKSDINQRSKISSGETNSTSYLHQTPLHVACEHGQLGAVKKLLSHSGIIINLKDYHRNTPMDICIKNDFHDIKLFIQTHKRVLRNESSLELSSLRIISSASLFFGPDTCMTKYLTNLDLSYNLLTTLPDSLLSLPKIINLNLSNNGIGDIPHKFMQLTTLQVLNIDNNRLQLPPIPFILLPKLKDIKCKNNPWKYLPTTAKENESTILGYCKHLLNSKVSWDSIKLMIVGSTNVGKSSLLHNLQKEGSLISSPNILKFGSKPSVTSLTKETLQVVKFNLPNKCEIIAYDFGNLEIFYRTYSYYLTARTIYIITFVSFKLDPKEIDYWIQQINTISVLGKSFIIVVGTHMDNPKFTSGKASIVWNCLKNLKQKGLIDAYHCVSNKTKVNISDLKQSLVTISEKHPIIKYDVTGIWKNLSFKCQYLKDTKKIQVIDWNQFHKLMIESYVEEKDSKKVLEFLRDTGILCYHALERNGNPDFIILTPEWLSERMVNIIDYFSLKEIKNGILFHDNLDETFSDVSNLLYEPVLNIFYNFEIAYSMRGDPQRSLFPSLLPDGLPPTISEFWSLHIPNDIQQYGRIYTFHVPALDVFSRLIVRCLHIVNTKSLLIWKQGIIISLDDEIAKVIYDQDDNSIVIKARTPKLKPTALLRSIVSNIDALVEILFQGSDKIQVYIPCLHCLRYNLYSIPFKFTKKQCIEAWSSGTPFVYCHNINSNSRCVRVDILAPDLSFGEIPVLKDLIIEKQIAEGGFGKVYKGTYIGETVAIKELHTGKEDFSSLFEEFSREVYTMSSLEHPNLVSLYGITVNPLRMVMEFVSGDLYHLLHSDVELSFYMRLRIALDVARGMRYLQDISPPIMHRDLRSPNILIASLDEDANVIGKVADFGLALSVAPIASGFLGTWQWHAPEVLDSESSFYNETADIYSYAILSWEIFTSGYPFEEYRTNPKYSHCVGTKDENGNDIWQFRIQNIKRAIVHNNLRPTFMDPNNIKVPEECQELIIRCWNANIDERPRFKEIENCLTTIMKKYYPSKRKLSNPQNNSKLLNLPNLENSGTLLASGNILSLDDYNIRYDTKEIKEKPLSIHFAANKVWIGCDKGTLMVFNARDCSLITLHKNHNTRIYSIVSIARQIWASSEDGSITIFDAISAIKVHQIDNAHENFMIRYLFALHIEDKSCVWSCAPLQCKICVWNAEDFTLEYTFNTGDTPITCFYINLQNIWLGTHKDILVNTIDYNTQTFQLINTLYGHTRKINGFSSPKNNEVWSCSDDGTIIAWSIQDMKQIKKMDVNSGSVRCIQSINDRVWTGGTNNSMIRWSVEEKIPKFELETSEAVLCICKVGTSVWGGTADKKLMIIRNVISK